MKRGRRRGQKTASFKKDEAQNAETAEAKHNSVGVATILFLQTLSRASPHPKFFSNQFSDSWASSVLKDPAWCFCQSNTLRNQIAPSLLPREQPQLASGSVIPPGSAFTTTLWPSADWLDAAIKALGKLLQVSKERQVVDLQNICSQQRWHDVDKRQNVLPR